MAAGSTSSCSVHPLFPKLEAKSVCDDAIRVISEFSLPVRRFHFLPVGFCFRGRQHLLAFISEVEYSFRTSLGVGISMGILTSCSRTTRGRPGSTGVATTCWFVPLLCKRFGSGTSCWLFVGIGLGRSRMDVGIRGVLGVCFGFWEFRETKLQFS